MKITIVYDNTVYSEGLRSDWGFSSFIDLDLICATHCTQHKTKIKELYPERYLEGGAGREIEI